MSEPFFERPILNSPYAYPRRHWELDPSGQPTQAIVENRRRADFITPIPKPKKRSGTQHQITFDEGLGLSGEAQAYDPTSHINPLRKEVDAWRELPEKEWRVTPETARLLNHWRHHEFAGRRPFFCQVEAVETVIWLTEVAPTLGARGRTFLDQLDRSNAEANPGLDRLALKLATGAGKTTVMAMLIAWQTVNAQRYPNSTRFTRGFLIVAPGITIKDRLRVLQPNDPDAYYAAFEIVPPDMLDAVNRARIVITNYHAFKLRERLALSAGGRALLQGRGDSLQTLETEGQMLQRVMPELMGIRGVAVLNDEAHHCYREKSGDTVEGDLSSEDRQEAAENTEAARLWISGLEAVQRTLGLKRVFDLSATPFFLSGSGYAEGTLFPWTMSDFSLMDAIECGIVKLPRVPVADNVPGGEMPKLRELWANLKKGDRQLPRAGRRNAGDLDPQNLPVLLQTALEALYGHYEKTFRAWEKAGVGVPPCFIVVCQNTAISKLVYEFVSGYERQNDDGTTELERGRFDLFRNYDSYDQPLARPNTLLIDSHQLESGEALDKDFRAMASDEIERFRREIRERTGDQKAAEEIADHDLLREVMNTVGKKGRLGEQIRCVVSVSMLTEGWDANTVTHVLGVRAFGTQLLCEQVVGRALRRLSYDLNDEGLFEPEYADVLGIPFDFAAKPIIAPPKAPRPSTHVHAVKEREALAIRFPRVEGYRVELPGEDLTAEFTADSVLTLTPELVGPTQTQQSGIIGAKVELGVTHLQDVRPSTLVYKLATRLMTTTWRDTGQPLPTNLFGPLRLVVRQWLDECLVCVGGTMPAQLQYQTLGDMACEKITNAITRAHAGEARIKALLDPFTPEASTRFVNFHTTQARLWTTDPARSHLNYAVLDSDWEGEFCRVAEAHPAVVAYAKNHNLGLEVPYVMGGQKRRYRPDFIVRVDDGREDLLNLVVEVKGYRGEDAQAKAETMETRWVPGVNTLGTFGRWAFAEFTEVFRMQDDFEALVDSRFDHLLGTATTPASP